MVSQREAIEMLKKANKEYDNLTAKKFSSDDRFCSHMTIVNKFGSWSAGLDKTGKSSGIDCPVCGKHYEKLGSHWRKECEYPEISKKKIEILKGCLMGDANFLGNDRIRITSITKNFLEYLEKELEWLVTETKIQSTAQESYENASLSFGKENTTKVENYSDVFILSTRKHPKIGSMKNRWYKDSRKTFPKELELSKTSTKFWYVCDGGLNFSSNRVTPTAQIGVSNEKHRKEYLLSLFKEKGFSPTVSDFVLHFPSKETEKLLDWFGKPVPGFEYKFQKERKNYLKLKP